jgi:predicted amidohydrolase YtcJ
LTIDPNRLKDARIDMTIVGGKVLYERRSGTASAQPRTP